MTTVLPARRATSLDALVHMPTLMTVARMLVDEGAMSPSEQEVCARYDADVDPALLDEVRAAIVAGTDPLGFAYCLLLSPQQRRTAGQTFTPLAAVEGMFSWAQARGRFDRIVDPGAGTGRYVLYGLRKYSHARGVASEADPRVALLLRANATALGLADRLQIHMGDFRELELTKIEGRTLFIGNPPYVRHHKIQGEWKEWYAASLRGHGHAASKLAGLHMHFYVKTLALARPGDLGCYITAAEWLNVNYGQSMRDMMTDGLGGRAVFVVSPKIQLFDDAMVSACIACFEPGGTGTDLEFKEIESVQELCKLTGGQRIAVEAAKGARNWSGFLRKQREPEQEGWMALGDLFKVSRGQVTGMNSVWVSKENRFGLPDEFLVPSITDASDIIAAPNNKIADLAGLRRVINLPASLMDLDDEKLLPIQEFLEWARSAGADKGWIARHRRPWWRVNMKPVPPQIVVTYMGRRPPVFAVNAAGAGIINVAHGLYPKVPLSHASLEKLVVWLNSNIRQESGRVYAGGLTKFEPSEVARLKVPSELFDGEAS